MTRFKNCGAAVVLPCAPAWSFGGKHKGDDLSPGPGCGAYPDATDWNSASTRFGGPPGLHNRPWQNSSAPYTGQSYLRPDYLSQNPKGPAWSFGQRNNNDNGLGPGVGAYSPNTNTFNFGKQRHGTWGPPPRPRPPSAPPRQRPESPDRRKPRMPPGFSFKGKYPPARNTDSPGPAYNPCCGKGGCCDACDKYTGPSFGIRHAIHREPPVPAPDWYHVGCSTLGAAAAGCNDGEDVNYHRPTRRDHAYASGIRP
ncbi:hypothetical protein HXX76_014502 [Chlamydomonas incerta]|uniref:Uncharacterized protein n=1 Tax=Chlamydomonas incerta TaxID=51695 RepID=A0A835SCI6_CHLIN|nr:hypothetical protein HXX76_014502 [Chlamydomonas incerta]|eukprot:KAG2424449.1 hypothetical protein HXX76_014502 [Chlamydomonas incerta]